MSIFDTILSSLRSLVGSERTDESESPPDETAQSESSRTEGRVSVEREAETDRDAADASTESVIKGTSETETEETPGEANEDAASTEGVAAETDAAASTETLVDEAEGKEPAEVVETAGEGEEAVVPDPDEDEVETAEDAAAAETDASASTETLVDEATGQEPAEAVAPTEAPEDEADEREDEADEGEDEEPDVPNGTDGSDDSENEDGSEADDSDDADDSEAVADEPEGSSEPVETLKGIGPAYAERLGSIGIETVSDLAAADPAEVAEGIDVSEKRVSGWIDRAQDDA